MRLFEIDNSGRTTEIKMSLEEIKTFLEEKCPIAYNSPFKIYRGIRSGSNYFMYGDSNSFERKSANTFNYYTLLLDNVLPEWKEYPKRSRSFICTTNKNYSRVYGRSYQVFPVGNPLIGICPDDDFWGSFQPQISDLGKFGRFLENLSEHIINIIGDYSYLNEDIQSLKLFISLIDSGWQKYKITVLNFAAKYNITFPSGMYGINSFTEALEYLFDPVKHNIQLHKLSNLSYENTTSEIWFSGPAYFLIQ